MAIGLNAKRVGNQDGSISVVRCSHRLLHELAIVLDGSVAQPLKVEGGIDAHLLAGGLAASLGPLELARVQLHLERLMAF